MEKRAERPLYLITWRRQTSLNRALIQWLWGALGSLKTKARWDLRSCSAILRAISYMLYRCSFRTINTPVTLNFTAHKVLWHHRMTLVSLCLWLNMTVLFQIYRLLWWLKFHPFSCMESFVYWDAKLKLSVKVHTGQRHCLSVAWRFLKILDACMESCHKNRIPCKD